ncbi:UNVERIFIED_CONTAM: hypothetical protein Sradi_1564900 [Sesamum radiatum]|uniref:Uncharacterized protein n=1 Tax=Sesamum radiatum TaxID=300843 RepID=A0AAW2UAA6_SESRA
MDKAASSQVASSPSRELAGREVASSLRTSSRGRWLTCDLCEMEADDHCFGRESLISKDHFWKGLFQSLLVWNEEIITL